MSTELNEQVRAGNVLNDLPGSKRDEITSQTPVCPEKNIRCEYWTENGCQIDICWMNKQKKRKTKKKNKIVAVTSKKQKIKQYMRSTHGV